MKKAFLCVIGLSAAFIFSAAPVSAATIRINYPKVQLELQPGETYSGTIVAENPTSDPVKTRIYLEDWRYAPGGNGEKIFSPPGTNENSAAKWITFSPAETEIPAFGRVELNYTVRVPAEGVKGGYYAVLFFETILGAATNEEGVNVLVAGRIGSLYYVEIKGLSDRQGKIESVEIKQPEGNKPYEIVTTFRNTGNTDVTVNGKYLIMDTDGVVKARGDVAGIYTVPGAVESSTTQWAGRLPKGEYQVLLTYDLGKGKTLVEEKNLSVP